MMPEPHDSAPTLCVHCGDTITLDDDAEWGHDSGTAWHLAVPEPHD
jgi:hypothetical protein